MATHFSVRRGAIVAIILAVTLVSGGLLAKFAMQQDRAGEASRTSLPAAKGVQNDEGIISFAPIVSKATPAVVSISAARIVRAGERNSRLPQLPPEFRDFFGFGDRAPFGGGPPQDRRQEGAGSGVIVTNDGYLLTNNHVVEEATEVRVILADRREFPAKIVGTDPQTDIAVLKVDASGLPNLPMSDSSRVRVGDLALAIGNPFGIGQTVTLGIISATGRAVGISAEGGYEDFIQTDAAINPGNSGGALINTRGELIGINTAIISRGGGNQGVGFAVPVNLARNVMDQIIKTGKVTRGRLGVSIQPMTPSLSRAFGLKEPVGVVITEVQPNSPAEKAGITSGDVITQINGKPVRDLNAFRLEVASTRPGTPVKLTLWRDGKEREVTATLDELQPQRPAAAPGAPGEGMESRSLTGVSVDTLTPQVARQLELPANTTGVVVMEVSQASPAFAAGLRRGDVIEEVNRKKVSNVSEFERAVAEAGNGPVLLLVRSQGGTRYVAVEQR
jgi:Do/DeqQ family serine protease